MEIQPVQSNFEYVALMRANPGVYLFTVRIPSSVFFEVNSKI